MHPQLHHSLLLLHPYCNIINQKFEREKKFKDKKLGKYIDELFNNELSKHSSDSRIIKNKLEFCNAVVMAITDFDILSEEARKLTEKNLRLYRKKQIKLLQRSDVLECEFLNIYIHCENCRELKT